MIIGITGQNKSGKGSVAKILEEDHGFIHVSSSEFLRQDLRMAGMQVTRANLQNLGNNLRKAYGTSYIARRILARIDEIRQNDSKINFVVESLRNVGEVTFLKEHDVIVWNIIADPKMRFNRMRQDNKENDPKTYHEFLDCEHIENRTNLEFAQQITEVQKYANVVIKNEGSLDLLRKKVGRALDDLRKKERHDIKNRYISWDEYILRFMDKLSGRKLSKPNKSR